MRLENSSLSEKITRETTIFKGKVVHLKELDVELPNGNQSKREVVYHPGAVAVLAEPKPGHLVFVKQYRTGPDEVLLEIPAGKLEPGEDPLDAALRELEEETGYRCQSIEQISQFYTSPGFANELITLFYATDLILGEASPDEDEFVHAFTLNREEIEEMLEKQEVRDAKTQVAILWWLLRQSGEK